MKKLLGILLLTFITSVSFSQKSKGDTLIVDTEKFNYIKVKDKVYKIETSVIVTETPLKLSGGWKVAEPDTMLYPIWRFGNSELLNLQFKRSIMH